jgi:hypothetical protein
VINIDRRVVGVALAAALALLGTTPVLAHSGGSEPILQIDPNPVTAGTTIILVGTNLEPDGDRQVTLAGQNLTVDFGIFKADAQGMLNVELKIPAYLPAGVYEIRAAADEVLTVECDVQAAAGMAATTDDSAQAQVVPHQRGAIEISLMASLVALSLALGAFLVWRTRPHRTSGDAVQHGSGPASAS